jgi:CBS domain-containing membrane protein
MEWMNQYHQEENIWNTPLSRVMNRKVVTVRSEQHIHDLIPYFVERSFNYIPVVEQQRLVGIVSRSDMIAAMQIQLNRLSDQLKIASQT